MELVVILFLIVFLIGLILAYKLGNKVGAFKKDRWWQKELPRHRKDAIMKSRAVLGGNFSEQLAPFLPDFKYLPTECKFLGKPIDLLVFKGMDEKRIDEVVFVEVKSGNSKLSSSERKLKEAIEGKRVRWEEYRVPRDLVRGKGDE
jgi:predicted Holliday junction resolvase-like endonuclease